MTKTAPYESHAVDYDNWFAGNRFAYESELRAVRELLPRGRTGIEIGVGTGRFAERLGIALGVEPSKAMGEIARTRGISIVRGVAEALPIRDARFDFALMVTVLCFFDDPERALREAYRILKPAGSLVVAFLDRDSPVGKAYDERKGESVYYRHATFYSAGEVASLLSRAGFRAPAFRQTIFRSPGKRDGAEPVREGYGQGGFVVVKAEK